eukprot:TRINITY_DN15068_c0_g1_i1.p1 TRINITY_DN15068_c0_g1~~TRINITY_DN15068_c0_g1_i1.p1  ORF type:complete len:436 (-),score=63.79 TRINITY_DN15068_c0_g1_i1:49-1356(-)
MGRRGLYSDTIGRAGLEVAGTPPSTPGMWPRTSASEGHGDRDMRQRESAGASATAATLAALARERRPNGGGAGDSPGGEPSPPTPTGRRFSAIRTLFQRFGCRGTSVGAGRGSARSSSPRGSSPALSPGGASSSGGAGGQAPRTPDTARSSDAMPWRSGGGRWSAAAGESPRAGHGDREARELELAIRRTLEARRRDDAGGRSSSSRNSRPAPLRVPDEGRQGQVHGFHHRSEAFAGRSSGSGGHGGGEPPSRWLGRDEPGGGAVREGRDRGMQSRFAAAGPPAWSQHMHGMHPDEEVLMARLLAQGVRDRQQAARMVFDPTGLGGYHAGMGRGVALPAYFDDALTGERGLQEAIEQSRKAHLLHELPREEFVPERHKDLTECELCLTDYERGDELMRLPCLHLFHCACVQPWLQKSYTCPVCQTDVCEAMGLYN